MAHLEVSTFLQSFISDVEPFFANPRVLEIGSYDVNGSVRSNFKNAKHYVGVDLIPGPSVDVVSKGHLYRSDAKFDIVLSVESFEHNADWVVTLANMVDLVADDGLIVFTCATTGRLEHGTYRTDPYSSPGTASAENSYYLNLRERDFREQFDFDTTFVAHGFHVNAVTRDLYFYGVKNCKSGLLESVETIFRRATDRSDTIRKQKSLANFLAVRALFVALSPLFLFLSDRSYQNLTYGFYKKIRMVRKR